MFQALTKSLANFSLESSSAYTSTIALNCELDPNNPLSANIDLDSVLVIFINGVLQTPGYAYQFTGGTSFLFMEAPKVNDKVDIFFYVGQDGVDVTKIEVKETIKNNSGGVFWDVLGAFRILFGAIPYRVYRFWEFFFDFW